MNPLRQKYSNERSYLLDNVGKHKINWYAETGAIYEIISIDGMKVDKHYDLIDCIVFSGADRCSYGMPDEFKEIKIEDGVISHVKRIKNIDYVKENSLIKFGDLGGGVIIGILHGFINDRGVWEGYLGNSSSEAGSATPHKIDTGLIETLPKIFEGDSSVVDFGCGNADYIRKLIDCDFICEAYDGNSNTPEMTDGIGKVLDLSKEFNLNKKFDYVISLEVAEHIPKEYEEIYVDNLIRHTEYHLIISWAIKGQGGGGHVNEQDEDYVLNLYKKKGMVYQKEISETLRSVATLNWFKKTIYVFGKG